MEKTRDKWNRDICTLFFKDEVFYSTYKAKQVFSGDDVQKAVNKNLRLRKIELQKLKKETKIKVARIIQKHDGLERELHLNMEQLYFNKKKAHIERHISRLCLFLKNDHPDSRSISEAQTQQAREYPIKQLCDTYGFRRQKNMVSCPFHGKDKNPSMSLHKNRYYCFTCGEKGDVIDLVRKMEGKTFIEAVKKLS